MLRTLFKKPQSRTLGWSISLLLGLLLAAGCATQLGTPASGPYSEAEAMQVAQAMMQSSFNARGQAGLDRLKQDDAQASCSLLRPGSVLPKDTAERIERAKADWRDGRVGRVPGETEEHELQGDDPKQGRQALPIQESVHLGLFRADQVRAAVETQLIGEPQGQGGQHAVGREEERGAGEAWDGGGHGVHPSSRLRRFIQ